MAIVSFDKDETIEYVPRFANNRESKDPCIAILKFMPHSRANYYTRMIAARTKGIRDQEQVTKITLKIQKQMFLDSVEKVSGYSVGSKEPREVSAPEEFYETADTELVEEIALAMQDSVMLEGGQLKNLQRASDTSS